LRKIRNDRHGVSNVMGYLFSFAIASMVMVSAVFVTMGIIEDKTSQVASLEAQSIANYISNAIAEAVTAKQSNPDAAYEIIWDLPSKIANKDYYIDVADSAVYVNTTDGRVSRSSTTYTAEELDIGVFSSKKIHGGEGRVAVIADSSDYLYKLDFGSGDVADHSPVEAGYYFVGGNSLSNSREVDWSIDTHPHRVPIRISNPSSSALINVPVRVVLNSSNFDYSNTNVTAVNSAYITSADGGSGSSPTMFTSDLRFYDPEPGIAIVVGATANPSTWYPHWRWGTDEEVNITITPDKFPTGMKTNYIDGDTLQWDGGGGKVALCKSYVGGENVGDPGYAIFDRAEAFQSLGYVVDGEIRNVSISGYFKDKTSFTGYCFVTIKFGNFSVDDDFNASTPGWGATHFDSIQAAINNANDRDTIYVYGGTYNECLTISDNINLVGASKITTIIDGTGVSSGNELVELTSSVTDGNITSLNIRKAGYPDNIGNGLALHGCSNVVVADCDIHHNHGMGIVISQGATYNTIIDCDSHDNYDEEYGVGADNGIYITGKNTHDNKVINCKFYDNLGNNSNGIIILDGAYDNLIENCDSYGHTSDSGDGLEIKNNDTDDQATSGNIIRNCSFYGQTGPSGDGIDIWTNEIGDPTPVYASYNQIINCKCYGNLDEGIGLQYGHHNIVRDCFFYGNGNEGVFIYDEEDSEVINCEVYDNEGTGILISAKSKNNKITNCEIYDNTKNGIKIKDEKLYDDQTNNNEIKYCEIYNSGENGILLEWAQDNGIQYCNVYDNDKNGLVIKGEGVGIQGGLYDDPMSIIYCNFFNNTIDGLQLLGTTVSCTNNITITDCNFYSNDRYGLYINKVEGAGTLYPKKNLIYRNNFANNTDGNAYDSSEDKHDNYWDVGGDGNYWDDLLDNPGYNPPGLIMYDISPSDSNDDDDSPRGPGHWERFNDSDVDDFWPNPNIIHVSTDYSSEHLDWFHTQTIQKAIDHVIPGGTIIVHTYPKQYLESNPLNINKSLRLIGDGLTEIVSTEAGPVINITSWSWGDLPAGFSATIYIDSFDINGADIADTGIYVDVSPMPPLGVTVVNISNCYIHNTGNGTYFDTVQNNITNCHIYYNTNGIFLDTSNNNNIENCQIYANTKSGIHLDSSDNNNINDSTIYSNQECGINLTSGSDKNNINDCSLSSNRYGIHLLNSGTVGNGNTINNCDIFGQSISNPKHGIFLEGSKGNVIKLCDIYRIKECGVNITGTSTDNEVFSNNFGCQSPVESGSGYGDSFHLYNGLNAWDGTGANSNKWNETKANGGGNYWDDYTGIDADYDGFGDSDYSIPGSANAKDKEPLPVPYEDPNYYRPFSIEYWNPDGNSILLVNVTVDANQEKDIYLYYGSNQLEIVSYASIAEFYDGFLSTLDQARWYWSELGIKPTDEWWKNNTVILQKSDFIITQNDVIKEPADPENKAGKHTDSEAMYVVEARVRLNNSKIGDGGENQANMMLLSQSNNNYLNTYMFSIHENVTSPGNLTLLHKYSQSAGNKKLDSYDMDQLFDRWWLMKSYIYLGKHNYTLGSNTNKTTATYITSFVYDYNTLANESEVSYTDGFYELYTGTTGESAGDSGTGMPFLKGKIGFGCGLLSGFNVNNSANITVDWVRVRKAPIVPPVVTVGAMESMNYGWNTQVNSVNAITSDPFMPGPLLQDYNNNPEQVNFIIRNIPNGTYSITITKGDNDYDVSGMTVNITDDNDNTYPQLEFPNTTKGSFETKWVTITVSDVDNSTTLILTFDRPTTVGTDVGPASGWRVNALTVERGERGVEVTLG
jgi:parallel beta-helix repeat protein